MPGFQALAGEWSIEPLAGASGGTTTMAWKRTKGSLRAGALAAAVGVLGGVLVTSGAPVFSATASVTVAPAADAFVSQQYPGTNYGGRSSLRVDASPVERS